MRFLASLIVVVVAGVAACSSTLQPNANGDAGGGGGATDGAVDGSYPVTFTCLVDGGADCPSGQPCPEVPLSSSACGDLPGVLGHESTPQTVGRPVGCVVGLSYGNPFFGDSQVQCYCAETGGGVQWGCPI